MSKANKIFIVTMILTASIIALAWVGYDNKQAMKVCQEKHSKDYCFKQIMR